MPERGRCGDCVNFFLHGMRFGIEYGECAVLTIAGLRVLTPDGDPKHSPFVFTTTTGCYPVADGGWYVKKEAVRDA